MSRIDCSSSVIWIPPKNFTYLLHHRKVKNRIFSPIALQSPWKSDFEGKNNCLQSNPAILCAAVVVFQNVWLEFFFSFFRLKHAQSELKKKQSELKNTEKSYKKDKDVYDAIEKSKTKLEVSEMSDDLLLCRLLSSFVALFLEISM